MIEITNIIWDSDNASNETLPTAIEIHTQEIDPAHYGITVPYTCDDILGNRELCDTICDYLTDNYGFCVDSFSVDVPEKQTYVVTVTSTATYTISADDIDQAEEAAIDWFIERTPSIQVTIDDTEEPEVEL